MKWLSRVLGSLLIVLGLSMFGFLALLAAQTNAAAGELLGRGWPLILMGLVAGALGLYLLAANRRSATPQSGPPTGPPSYGTP